MLKLRECNQWRWSVEMPNTDANRCFPSLHQCYDFLKENYNLDHTDVDVDMDKCNVTVPSFAESRKRYSESKAKQIARYGD